MVGSRPRWTAPRVIRLLPRSELGDGKLAAHVLERNALEAVLGPQRLDDLLHVQHRLVFIDAVADAGLDAPEGGQGFDDHRVPLVAHVRGVDLQSAEIGLQSLGLDTDDGMEQIATMEARVAVHPSLQRACAVPNTLVVDVASGHLEERLTRESLHGMFHGIDVGFLTAGRCHVDLRALEGSQGYENVAQQRIGLVFDAEIEIADIGFEPFELNLRDDLVEVGSGDAANPQVIPEPGTAVLNAHVVFVARVHSFSFLVIVLADDTAKLVDSPVGTRYVLQRSVGAPEAVIDSPGCGFRRDYFRPTSSATKSR